MPATCRRDGTLPSALRPPTWVLAAAVLAAGLVGCSDDEQPDGPGEADVTYAASVVAHHAQTVQLLNLRPSRPSAAVEIGLWVDAARMRRLREVGAMERSLRSWGEAAPETGLKHSDEGKHIEFDPTIAGVLTDPQIEAVTTENGRRFMRAWLQALIRHEQGAVQLAEAELDAGQDAATVELAEDDRDAHLAQIARLERILATTQH